MEQGMIDVESGKEHCIEIRSRIESGPLQALLAQYAGRCGLTCMCRLHEGVALPLAVRRLPTGRYTLVRPSVGEHAPNCFLHRLSDMAELEHEVAAAMFDRRPVISGPSEESGSASQEALRRRTYGNFASYALGVIADATAQTLFVSLQSAAAHRWRSTVPPADALGGIADAISRRLTSAGSNGYVAAREADAELRYGLVYEIPTVRPNGAAECEVWWWTGNTTMSLQTVSCLPGVVAPALDALRVFGRVRPPPYFLLAVQDATGWLRRAFLHQVHVSRHALVFVESGVEANYAAHLERERFAFLKPVQLASTRNFLRQAGLWSEAEEPLAYRPDFLVFQEVAGRIRLHVREVRGFAVGRFRAYDEHLARKEHYYNLVCTGPQRGYKTVDGGGLGAAPDSVPPAAWLPPCKLEVEAPILASSRRFTSYGEILPAD